MSKVKGTDPVLPGASFTVTEVLVVPLWLPLFQYSPAVGLVTISGCATIATLVNVMVLNVPPFYCTATEQLVMFCTEAAAPAVGSIAIVSVSLLPPPDLALNCVFPEVKSNKLWQPADCTAV
jgi:hypothetical protein